MEIEIWRTILITKTFDFVFDGMRLDKIHDDAQAEAMRRINEFLQFVRRSEKVADGEEIRDMVTEGAVERMLLNGHQLDGVVASVGDSRQR